MAADDVINQLKSRIGRPIFRDVSFSDKKIEKLKSEFFQKKSNEGVLPGSYVLCVERRFNDKLAKGRYILLKIKA